MRRITTQAVGFAKQAMAAVSSREVSTHWYVGFICLVSLTTVDAITIEADA